MELFELVKKIFKSEKDWNKVSRNDKTKNFFMVNRIMSIQFPVQANQFNHTKISPRPVVDWWHNNLSRYYTKTPNWIFTKTKKSENPLKSAIKVDHNQEAEKFVMEKFEISKREIQDLKKFYPNEYSDWIAHISQQMSMDLK
jgi:hypothetical protein